MVRPEPPREVTTLTAPPRRSNGSSNAWLTIIEQVPQMRRIHLSIKDMTSFELLRFLTWFGIFCLSFRPCPRNREFSGLKSINSLLEGTLLTKQMSYQNIGKIKYLRVLILNHRSTIFHQILHKRCIFKTEHLLLRG